MINLNINKEIEVDIIKIINKGLGLAKLSNGFNIFVENACPLDKLKIKITKLNKNYGYGEIVEIIKPSPYRVKGDCSLIKVCGGCQLNHIDYQEQLNIKDLIVKEIFERSKYYKNINIYHTVESKKKLHYRCKIQLPVKLNPISKKIKIGYYEKESHKIVNIKYCYLAPDLINNLVEKIRTKLEEFKISIYDEKTHTGELRHIIFRYSEFYQNVLVTFVINKENESSKINKLATKISEEKNINGVSINLNTSKSNIILGKKTYLAEGKGFIIEKLGDIFYKISTNSFFQINPNIAEKILNTVKSYIQKEFNNPVILDAYSGVGTFSMYLASIAKKIIAVEEVPSATKDCKENLELNRINNIEIYTCDVKEKLKEISNKKEESIDCIILDPPRAGVERDVIDIISDKIGPKMIVYLSCNPSTLSRDLEIFYDKGYKAEFVQPYDMFPNTYHIECLTILKNENM